MKSYVLLHLHDFTCASHYFKSKLDWIDGLTFGGEDFQSDLNTVGTTIEEGGDETEYTFEDLCQKYPGWETVSKILEKLGIDFEPGKQEDILIEQLPDEIAELMIE